MDWERCGNWRWGTATSSFVCVVYTVYFIDAYARKRLATMAIYHFHTRSMAKRGHGCRWNELFDALVGNVKYGFMKYHFSSSTIDFHGFDVKNVISHLLPSCFQI